VERDEDRVVAAGQAAVNPEEVVTGHAALDAEAKRLLDGALVKSIVAIGAGLDPVAAARDAIAEPDPQVRLAGLAEAAPRAQYSSSRDRTWPRTPRL